MAKAKKKLNFGNDQPKGLNLYPLIENQEIGTD